MTKASHEPTTLIPALDENLFREMRRHTWEEAQDDFEFIQGATKANGDLDMESISQNRASIVGLLHTVFDLTANGDSREDLHDAISLGIFDELLRCVRRLADTLQRAALVETGALTDNDIIRILTTSSQDRPYVEVPGVDRLHGDWTEQAYTEQE